MKKLLTFILTATIVLTLTACGDKETVSIGQASSIKPATSTATVSVSKETVSVSSAETAAEEPVAEPADDLEAAPAQEGLVTETPKEYEYSIVITINPAITLFVTYNDNNEAIVSNFKFDNDDAKEAYSDLALVNLKTDDAIKLIINTAAAKEYLKADGNVTIDVQPAGDALPGDVVESYKETAEAAVKELDGHTGEVIVHNFDISGNEVVAEAPKAEDKKEVAKAEDKKDNSKNNKKEESKKESKTDSKKDTAKTETNTETNTNTDTNTQTQASTPEAIPEFAPAQTPAPTPAPAPKKCDMNHNTCSNISPAWGQEHYEDVPYEYRLDHTDTWYSIVHAVHRINGWIPCTNCGGQIPLLSYDQDVSEDDWRYEMDTNAYNAAINAAYDAYYDAHPEASWEEASSYAHSMVNESSFYGWVQY